MLLLHGFGDTPQTFAYLAPALHAAGFTVSAPLLPGHGRSLEEFVRSTASEWISHARAEYADMTRDYHSVGLAGLSMGGALAAIVAADSRDLRALVLLAPYVGMPPIVTAAALLHRAWGPFAGEFKAASDRSIVDPEERARNLAYGVTTAGAIRQLYAVTRIARGALRSITAPTLIVQARGDNRVSRRVAERAFKVIPAEDKRLIFVDRGGHVLTVDYDRELVSATVRDWFDQRLTER